MSEQLDKNIKFRVYPPKPYVRNSLKVTAVTSGYRDTNTTFTISKWGQEIWLPANDGDQVDTIPLNVTFKIHTDTKGNFEIDDNSKKYTLQGG